MEILSLFLVCAGLIGELKVEFSFIASALKLVGIQHIGHTEAEMVKSPQHSSILSQKRKVGGKNNAPT